MNLRRQIASNGVVFYTSPRLSELGVPHGFSTRLGGISPQPFDSLNLGNPSGCDVADDYDRIWENYRLLAVAAGCPDRELLRVHQVHGATVALAHRGSAFDPATRADAIVTDDPDRVASVRVADCVPVLLADASGKAVAAVHAGWRGVVSCIVPAALKALCANTAPADVTAAIGPCIGPDAFEVGPEVADEFQRVFASRAPVRRGENGKYFVDLRAAVRLQLLEMGVLDARIDQSDRCTVRNSDEFFSHRRENGRTGRMAAIIAPAAR